MFVTSDRCAACLAQVPSWIALLDELQRTGGGPFQVVVLSKHGTLVPSRLRAAFDGRLFVDVVDNVSRFAQRTGIGWTPALVLLDPSHRLRLITETLTPTIRREFIEAIQTRSRKETGKWFDGTQSFAGR